MSESRSLLVETADRLFGDLVGDRALAFGDVWGALDEAGFPVLLLPEAQGGFGGDWGDLHAVARLAGRHALAAPLADAALASWLASDAGLSLWSGLGVISPDLSGRLDQNRFSGVARAVPWAGHATVVLGRFEDRLIRLDRADATIEEGVNPAGEPRPTLTFDNASCETAPSGRLEPFACGAFARACQIAGALDGALEMAIGYANERVQFGKPIGKFQAVQQALAVFAVEAAAVNSAAQAAGRAVDGGEGVFELAAAKVRANLAAGTGGAIAHQVHGAIGFTQEHGLHHFTRRLTSWRSEFGSDRFWSQRLGEAVAARGADAFWPDLTRRSDGPDHS